MAVSRAGSEVFGLVGDRRTRVRALAVPVDGEHGCSVIMVPRQVARLGLAIRGGPLHPSWVSDSLTGTVFTWCGERREAAVLTENPRAVALAARLGVVDLVDRIGLRGNVIVTGLVDDGQVRDVPRVVLEAACRTGLLDGLMESVTAPIALRALVEPVEPIGADTDGAGVLPCRPLSAVPASGEVLVWEDATIMARVLAGLEADSSPEPAPVPEWDADSWWKEHAM